MNPWELLATLRGTIPRKYTIYGKTKPWHVISSFQCMCNTIPSPVCVLIWYRCVHVRKTFVCSRKIWFKKLLVSLTTIVDCIFIIGVILYFEQEDAVIYLHIQYQQSSCSVHIKCTHQVYILDTKNMHGHQNNQKLELTQLAVKLLVSTVVCTLYLPVSA